MASLPSMVTTWLGITKPAGTALTDSFCLFSSLDPWLYLSFCLLVFSSFHLFVFLSLFASQKSFPFSSLDPWLFLSLCLFVFSSFHPCLSFCPFFFAFGAPPIRHCPTKILPLRGSVLQALLWHPYPRGASPHKSPFSSLLGGLCPTKVPYFSSQGALPHKSPFSSLPFPILKKFSFRYFQNEGQIVC